MSVDRKKITDELEHVRTFVNDANLSMAEDERTSLNEALDKCIRYAKYRRYHVTTLGVFSSGKSTLLNAMLEDKLLPAADLPVTAITTEIYYSENTSFFIPMENVSEELLADFQHGICSLNNTTAIKFVSSLQRDGDTVSGVGGILDKHDSGLIYKIITELTSQQRRGKEPFVGIKNILDSNHDLTLWLGISTLPVWLRDIVLTDAPGTGSIDDSHEIIINKVIPESQLVLYLIESTKVGSAIDKRFCNRVSNTYHRKIFYVLNKIDQQNGDERAEAMDCAKRCVPDVTADGEKPEFLCVAGLHALISHELSAEKISINDIFTDAKINVTQLLIKPEWGKADEVEKKRILAEYLLNNSKFITLRNRVEEYLRWENKDVAIEQQANATIVDVSRAIARRCDNAVRVLNSDKTPDELRQKKEEAHDSRCKFEREADTIINDYKCSVLDHDTGLGATIAGLLAPVPTAIACRLNETLVKDSESYKKLQKKEELEKWLRRELGYCIEDVARKMDNELQKRYKHLLEQLLPILRKIEEVSLANSLSSIKVEDTYSTDTTNAFHVAGSAVAGALVLGTGAWALTALGIGVSAGTAASGVAGFLAAHGLAGLASSAAGIGWGTLGTASTTLFGLSAAGFFIPVIGVGAVAATIIASICFGKKWKIEQIVSKTKELLDKIVLNGGSVKEVEIIPVASKMRESVEEAIKRSLNDISERIKTRLRQMDDEEEKLLEESVKASEIKQEKVDKINKLKTEIELIEAVARKTMKQPMGGN